MKSGYCRLDDGGKMLQDELSTLRKTRAPCELRLDGD